MNVFKLKMRISKVKICISSAKIKFIVGMKKFWGRFIMFLW